MNVVLYIYRDGNKFIWELVLPKPGPAPVYLSAHWQYSTVATALSCARLWARDLGWTICDERLPEM